MNVGDKVKITASPYGYGLSNEDTFYSQEPHPKPIGSEGIVKRDWEDGDLTVDFDGAPQIINSRFLAVVSETETETLTPQKGDRVWLVHKNGDEANVTVTDVWDDGIDTETTHFTFASGWSIADVLPKPLPPAGTFIKGTLHDGEEFAGITRTQGVNSISKGGDFDHLTRTEIASWEEI